MPTRKRQISVYRTDNLVEGEIWNLGDDFVGTAAKPIIARADLSASQITMHQLAIQPVPDPEPRHANIIGWPEDEELQRVIAIELANIAILTTHPR